MNQMNDRNKQLEMEMELDTKLTMDLLANSVSSESRTDRPELARFSSKMDTMIAKYTSPAAEDCKHGNSQELSRNYCRPWNYADYLNRLATFRETHRWFAKPAHLSPPECALKGWSCSEIQMDTLVCKCCEAKVTFDKTEQATASKAAQEQLSSGHSSECGWRALGGCDRSFLDLPGLQSERGLCAAALTRAVSVVDALLLLDVRDAARASFGSTAVTVRFGSGVPPGAAQACEACGEAAPALLSKLRRALEAAVRCVQSDAPGLSKRGACAEDGQRPLLAVARAARGLLLTGNPSAYGAEDLPTRLMKVVLMIAVSGWQFEARGEGPNGTRAASSSLHCSLCSRSVSLAPAVEGDEMQECELKVDCTAQHRYFCPYVLSPALAPTWSDRGAPDAIPGPSSSEWKGWEISALALSRLHLSDGAVVAGERDVNSQQAGANTEEGPVQPEQAYKRVRSVLDLVGK